MIYFSFRFITKINNLKTRSIKHIVVLCINNIVALGLLVVAIIFTLNNFYYSFVVFFFLIIPLLYLLVKYITYLLNGSNNQYPNSINNYKHLLYVLDKINCCIYLYKDKDIVGKYNNIIEDNIKNGKTFEDIIDSINLEQLITDNRIKSLKQTELVMKRIVIKKSFIYLSNCFIFGLLTFIFMNTIFI